MTIKLIIYSLCCVMFAGYVVLALHLLLHGAYIYWCEASQEREAQTINEGLGCEAKPSEEDKFVYQRQRQLSRHRLV